jgi:hypothetical protein
MTNENKTNQTSAQTNQTNQQQTNQANVQGSAQGSAQGNQANNQQVQQMIKQGTEAKTVVNGKVVPLKQVQVAEELFNQQNTQTGIQDHHNNQTEAVQSGQIAQQNVFGQNMQQALSEAMTSMESAKSFMNQANVQSGQQHLESFMQQAQQEIESAQQQIQRATAQMQNRAQQSQQQSSANGMPEVLAQHVEDAEAVQKSVESSQARAKARATKKD